MYPTRKSRFDEEEMKKVDSRWNNRQNLNFKKTHGNGGGDLCFIYTASPKVIIPERGGRVEGGANHAPKLYPDWSLTCASTLPFVSYSYAYALASASGVNSNPLKAC